MKTLKTRKEYSHVDECPRCKTMRKGHEEYCADCGMNLTEETSIDSCPFCGEDLEGTHLVYDCELSTKSLGVFEAFSDSTKTEYVAIDGDGDPWLISEFYYHDGGVEFVDIEPIAIPNAIGQLTRHRNNLAAQCDHAQKGIDLLRNI